MTTDFWQQQTVLLTGASGFLGRHVLDQLEQHGPREIVTPTRRWYDLRQRDHVISLFAENHDITLVIHLAATVGGIGLNREQPGRMVYDNILMNTHVLDSAQRYGVDKFVGIGSVCAYPKHTPVPFSEDDLFNGYPEETNAPYGETKRLLLIMGQAYRQQYGLNAIHLMPTNLYGPGDNFDPQSSHVIPALIRRMHEAKMTNAPEVTIWGDGSASREFLYVEEAARAILRAAEHYNAPEPVNIGSGQEITIGNLARKIAQVVGYTGDLVFDTSKPNGQPRRCLDTSRARAFGFEARTTFDDGLRVTYDWYTQQIGVAA